MSGLVLGLLLGLGLVLVLLSVTVPVAPGGAGRGALRRRAVDLLADAGCPGRGPAALVAACIACGLTTAAVVLMVSASLTLAAVFGAAATTAPVVLLRRRVEQRRDALRAVWPDVVDDLASAVRAGLGLPDALASIGTRAAPAIAPAFARFDADYRGSGRFGPSLDALKDRLADPVADRIVESLRVAREVGGSDLGALLRSLSAFLREDARSRGELETRQGWTVNAARVAAAAPWVTLLLLSTRPEAVRAYDTPAGAFVLLGGAVVTVVAYRVMLRIGRLPQEPRVLR